MKSHANPKAKARTLAPPHGFTLIETLVAVSFGSSIMLTAVALVHTAFKMQSLTQKRVELTCTLDRYVEQFRRDVSLADRVELPTEKTLKLFFVGEQQVEYHTDENRIMRRSFDGDQPRQVEQVQLEVGRTTRFTQSDFGRCVMFDILEREDNQSADTPRTMRQMVVAVGRMNGAGGPHSEIREAITATSTLFKTDTSPSDSTPKDEPSGNVAVEEQ